MEAWLDNSLFKGLNVPMFFFLSSFKVPMCLLGCSGFAFLRKNAKKSSVMYSFLLSSSFPLYGGFSTLVYPFFLHCLFSLKFTYPNSPFCVFSFFSFLSTIRHPPSRLSFFLVRKKKKKRRKKLVKVCLWWMKCTRASEHRALRLKLNPYCYLWVELMAVSSLVESWDDRSSVVGWYTEQGGEPSRGRLDIGER